MSHLHVPPTNANEYGVYPCAHCGEWIIPNESNSGWTTEWGTGTVKSAFDYYCTLSLAELRKRQDLTRQQQGLLYEQDRAANFTFGIIRHRARVNLTTQERLLTEAIMETHCPA